MSAQKANRFVIFSWFAFVFLLLHRKSLDERSELNITFLIAFRLLSLQLSLLRVFELPIH
jgi:hypothetical protein